MRDVVFPVHSRALGAVFHFLGWHLSDLLILFPLQYVHVVFAGQHAGLLASALGHLVGLVTILVGLMIAALLYLELERATPRPSPGKQGIGTPPATS
ncbi:MAG: hypothetical protein KKI08_19015 [Armatimonadetes bacterium]|nr:hypothetical protein [Armatimonadota bacterium]